MCALITCSCAIELIIFAEEENTLFSYENMVVNKDLKVLWLKLGHASPPPSEFVSDFIVNEILQRNQSQ